MAPATQATILDALGETYHGLGLVSESVAVNERALSIRRDQFGAEDPEMIRSMNQLALAYEPADHKAQKGHATQGHSEYSPLGPSQPSAGPGFLLGWRG